MTPISAELRAHLERVHDVVQASAYPMPIGELVRLIGNAERVFLARAGSEAIGHAEVTRNAVSPHRASVSVAIEAEHQGKGIGPLLLGQALAWCDQQETGIEWVDGWAWADNTRARKMDAAAGFAEVAIMEDVLRLPDGTKRDQVILVRGRAWPQGQ